MTGDVMMGYNNNNNNCLGTNTVRQMWILNKSTKHQYV